MFNVVAEKFFRDTKLFVVLHLLAIPENTMFLVKVVCITHHGNVISIHTFTYYAAFKTTVVSPTIICHIMMCLLHVLASTGPSTRRSPTKKTADSVVVLLTPLSELIL
jgi:hypothetical protein